jgi:hypothetical protein
MRFHCSDVLRRSPRGGSRSSLWNDPVRFHSFLPVSTRTTAANVLVVLAFPSESITEDVVLVSARVISPVLALLSVCSRAAACVPCCQALLLPVPPRSGC